MRCRIGFSVMVLALLGGLALPATVAAQIPRMKDVKKAADEAAKREILNKTDELVAGAVRCVFDNLECIRNAEEDGEPVVLTDREGEILTDEEGNPITDPSQLPPGGVPGAAPAVPGGVASTYDFEPGDRELFVSDFSADVLGDFPRGLEFIEGNMQVVEWQGRRFLRNEIKHSVFLVQLPETLPEQFTIEFEMYDPAGATGIGVALSEPPYLDWRWSVYYEADHFKAGDYHGSGIWSDHGKQVSTAIDMRSTEGLVPVRIMVDGAHAKMFIGENRVANVPKADLPRSDKVYFFVESRPPDQLAYITNIRIAAGGRDLYDALEADGRVTIRDILFDTNSATIQSESAPILEQIGMMMQQHPELKLMVEGHTDDEGDFDWNMELSADRAASVKAYLVENFGIDADRMRTMGLGPTQPVDSNETQAGKQKNRRVELVKF